MKCGFFQKGSALASAMHREHFLSRIAVMYPCFLKFFRRLR